MSNQEFISKKQAQRLAREWQELSRKWAKVAREAFTPSVLVFENIPLSPIPKTDLKLPLNPKRFEVARDEALNARDNAAHYLRLAQSAQSKYNQR